MLRSSRWSFLPHLSGWFIFGHLASPSDFWLFLRLKDYLGDKQFTNDEEVKQAAAEFHRSCPLGFYREGISRLVMCYEKWWHIQGEIDNLE